MHEVEPNDGLTDPLQTLDGTGAVLGFLGSETSRLFAVDASTSQIIEFDPASGVERRRMAMPEPASGGPDALAFDGRSLYFGSGSFFGGGDVLYEINPDTGAVIDSNTFADIGLTSGVDGLGAIGGRLIASDTVNGQVLFVDTGADRVVGSWTAPVSIRGGLTGAGARGTVFANDFFTGTIYELDAGTGAVSRSIVDPSGSTFGLAFVGGSLYVGDNSSGSIYQIDPDTGVVQNVLATSVQITALGGDDASGAPPFFATGVLAAASANLQGTASSNYRDAIDVTTKPVPVPWRSAFTAYPFDPAAIKQAIAQGSKAQTSDPGPTMTGVNIAAAVVAINESEPNDDRSQANAVPLGFGPGESSSVDVVGDITAGPPPTAIFPVEKDGAIPFATDTGLIAGASVLATAVIGDGAFAFTSGDYDWYAVRNVQAGQQIGIDVDAESIGSPLDSVVGLYDSTGTRLADNDDASGLDSALLFTAPAADDYFVVVRGFGNGFQIDPFDPASGAGAASTGNYQLTISLDSGDVDFFALDLNAGDILGANLLGAATLLRLASSTGQTLIGSAQDITFIHPDASPLPGGGIAALSWVVATDGTYTIAVSGGQGPYTLNLRLFRPELEIQVFGQRQTLFLDFDGATIDRSIFGVPGTATLSPLTTFLSGWGLSASDENTVIDSIVAGLSENIDTDLCARANNGCFDLSGVPGDFDIEILNSRDHADAFGTPNVSRVIVGGSTFELGIDTVGIAESIDVGNFQTAETAVVLLDALSGPAGEPASLNQYVLDPSVTIIDLIGSVVGIIVAHEAGHLFANWHTSRTSGAANIMDEGGDLDNTIGLVGPVWGDGDEIDVDFGPDDFSPREGFTGVEDTLNAIAFGLSTGTLDPALIGPSIVNVDPPAGVQNDLGIGRIVIRFDEALDRVAAEDASNYQLLEAGPNGVLENGSGDDELIALMPSLDATATVVTLAVADAPLSVGRYELTVSGGGIVDTDGNPLNSTTGLGGGADQVHRFEIELAPAGDLYQFTAAARQIVTLTTAALFDDPATTPRNDLDAALVVLDAAGTPLGGDNDSLDGKNARLTFIAPADGTYVVQVVAESGSGAYVLDVNIGSDTAPPVIKDVLVRGTSWSQAFGDQLAANGLGDGGYSIPVGGAAQFDTLPWLNVNQLIVRFSEEVLIDEQDLRLQGVLGPNGVDDANVDYGFAGLAVRTGPTGDFEAVWTLASALAVDRLLMTIDGSTATAVTDLLGNVLDGDWLDARSLYPSGEGTAGGDFAFRFNSLPGDTEPDEYVVADDVLEVRVRMGQMAGMSPYSHTHDLDANGFIVSGDVLAARARLGDFLPL